MTSLQDFGLAYRKAKVDLYYLFHVVQEATAGYEDKLRTILDDLNFGRCGQAKAGWPIRLIA